MMEICVSGFLVISVSISFLLWRALAAAKQADYRMPGISNQQMIEPTEEGAHLIKLVPAPHD